MSLIESGKKAPAFTLKDQHGQTHRLSDYSGKYLGESYGFGDSF